MTEEFIFCQKSYGNTTRLIVFYTSKIISLPFTPRPNKSPKKMCLKIRDKISCTLVLLILNFFDPNPNSYGFASHSKFQFFIFEENFTKFNLALRGLTPGRYPYQKLLQYDQRPSDIILWKQGNFCESKLLWIYKLIFEIFKRFFHFRNNRSKACY